jgi:hypothetical protein
MAGKKSFWYHLGHALERARPAPAGDRAVPGLAERRAGKEPAPRDPGTPPSIPDADELLSAGVAVAVDRALSVWTGRHPPRLTSLVRAGASGAAASLLVDLLRPLVTGRGDLPTIDRGTVDRMLAGVGQGLIYGSLVEPRLPGPALVKGSLYGSAEFLTDPLGGLSELLHGHVPQRHLPVLGELLDGLADHERAYLEHLVFGIALALLYESRSSSNGILLDEE